MSKKNNQPKQNLDKLTQNLRANLIRRKQVQKLQAQQQTSQLIDGVASDTTSDISQTHKQTDSAKKEN